MLYLLLTKDKSTDKEIHTIYQVRSVKEKSTPRHIVIKKHNTKTEDFKNPREKSQGTYKEQKISYQKTFIKKQKYNKNLFMLTTIIGSSYYYYFYLR